MNNLTTKTGNVEKTETVYLDGIKYIRVYFDDENTFHDIKADYYPIWLDAIQSSL